MLPWGWCPDHSEPAVITHFRKRAKSKDDARSVATCRRFCSIVVAEKVPFTIGKRRGETTSKQTKNHPKSKNKKIEKLPLDSFQLPNQISLTNYIRELLFKRKKNQANKHTDKNSKRKYQKFNTQSSCNSIIFSGHNNNKSHTQRQTKQDKKNKKQGKIK